MKVLIVKIGALGDVVMALSMVESVDRQWPNAHVTWVCGSSVGPLLKEVQRINDLIVVDDQKLLKGNIFSKLSVLIPLWIGFFGKTFDLIATGHSDGRYKLLSLTARGKLRRGFGNATGEGKLIPGRYHADEYARLITGVNGPEAKAGLLPKITIPLNSSLLQKIQSGKKVVALAPGGAKNIMRDDVLRRWPIEDYAQLAQKLLEKGHQVLLTGSSSDLWIKKSFESTAVTDLVGQTSIRDLIALYQSSDLIITHDSGPLHLAVLSKKPVIALFGPTNPWEKVPRQERIRVIWGGEYLACRPCYDGRNYAKCHDNQCLKGVPKDQVLKAALEMLVSPQQD